MDEYKPNSHRYREQMEVDKPSVPEKNVTQVANGKVKQKSLFRRLVGTIVQDSLRNVLDNSVEVELGPSLAKLIADFLKFCIDSYFAGPKGGGKNASSVSRVSYRSYSDDSSESVVRRTSMYDYDDILFPNRGEAEEVLDQMRDLISTYKVVSVLDMYDLAGIEIDRTADNYGWASLSGASIVRTRDGYLLKMPRPLPINH